MKHLLLILSFTLGLTTVAQAGFVNNKSTWDSMSLEVKYGYVMGMYDDLVAGYYNDGAREKNRKKGFRECATRLNLSAIDMVEIIDTEYKDLASWQYPPLLMKGLCTVCRPACD